MTARLREGADERARELLAEGPPFDPGRTGLARHTVYAGGETLVFVFEGEHLERTLPALLNDRLRAGAFAAWGAFSRMSLVSRMPSTTGVRRRTR